MTYYKYLTCFLNLLFLIYAFIELKSVNNRFHLKSSFIIDSVFFVRFMISIGNNPCLSLLSFFLSLFDNLLFIILVVALSIIGLNAIKLIYFANSMMLFTL